MRRIILGVLVALLLAMTGSVAIGQEPRVIIQQAQIFCAKEDGVGELVPEVVYTLWNQTDQTVSYEVAYRVDDNPPSAVTSGQLDPSSGPTFSFQTTTEPGRRITLEVTIRYLNGTSELLRSDPLVVPDCSGTYTIEGTARCDGGAPVIDYTVTGPPRYGMVVSSPNDNPTVYPFTGELTGTLRPTGTVVQPGAEITIGAHPLDILLQGGSTGFQVASDTVTIPDCSVSTTTSTTTTSTTSTTLPPTTMSTTLPTTTTTPPKPCDCEGFGCRQTTVPKAAKLVERAEKESLDCFTVRLVQGGYLVSACGPAAVLDRVFGKQA